MSASQLLVRLTACVVGASSCLLIPQFPDVHMMNYEMRIGIPYTHAAATASSSIFGLLRCYKVR